MFYGRVESGGDGFWKGGMGDKMEQKGFLLNV